VSDSRCEKYQSQFVEQLDGGLGKEDEAALLRHIEECAVCRDACLWMRNASADLFAMGDEIRKHTPPINLIEAVLGEVAKMKAREGNVSRFEPRSSRARFGWAAGFAGLAAAAAAVFLVWVSGYRMATDPAPGAGNQQAQGPAVTGEGPAAPPARPKLEDDGLEKTILTELAEVNRFSAEELASRRGERTAPGTESIEGVASLSLDDVLSLRKQAVTDPEAREQLARWASLATERAREIVMSETVSTAAKVGAAQALPPEEAQPILLAAATAQADNPYLRYQLSRSYAKTPETASRAVAELQQAAQLDPGNATALYDLATQLFQTGDVQGAMDALEQARSLQGANAYSSESAASLREALVATGMPDDVARLMAALTAGSQQYTDLVQTSQQLLEYGRQFEQSGDIETAQQIFEAVYTMGTQIASNATYSSEQLAGLDIQNDALDVLSGFVSFLENPQNVQMLAEQTRGLLEAFSAIGEFFTAIDQVFNSDHPASFFDTMSDFILQNGDLGFLDYLAQNPRPGQ